MGWGWLTKIPTVVNTGIGAGKIIATLFPERTKKLERTLDSADQIADRALEALRTLFDDPQVRGSLKTVISVPLIQQVAETAYGLSLTEEQAVKVYEYLRRNLQDTLHLSLMSIRDGRG